MHCHNIESGIIIIHDKQKGDLTKTAKRVLRELLLDRITDSDYTGATESIVQQAINDLKSRSFGSILLYIDKRFLLPTSRFRESLFLIEGNILKNRRKIFFR